MSFHTYHLISQTILHCGSGQSVGIVDQPIIRERATNLPIVPGATIRGVLRAHLSTDDSASELTRSLFGQVDGTDNFAGALSVTDAHLLVLPVRSVYGIVAYATCPFILRRYKKEMVLKLSISKLGQAICSSDSQILVNKKVVLEELDIDAQSDESAQEWAEQLSQVIYASDTEAQQDFKKHFVILPDDVFSYLAETATEVRTRIRMDQETGVVAEGALWTEESLPAESVLWGSYSFNEHTKGYSAEYTAQFQKHAHLALLQMGGNAGVGNGLVQLLTQGD
ncbi:type III-B CRISPR module RAMP protein Cmr4 [Celerinatantimonas sp. MCCC 1A17872]|uniref:type III-B CRISPR module RAMP protein Cmr4 n=1 Tax=Celerinatantimonas sp. MCCC 1A17872 TaxID=3177514 RepID=UPI0038C296FF